MGKLTVKHSNPEGLFNKGLQPVVTVSGNGKTIYIGGQNAINSEGQLVGGTILSFKQNKLWRILKLLWLLKMQLLMML